MINNSLLLSLPPEILLSVSIFLDIHNLIQLRLVCKRFCQVLDGDTRTRYRIALFQLKFQNGPLTADPKSYSERLKRFTEYQNAWDTKSWSWSATVNMGESVQAWEMLSGIFGLLKKDSSLEFIQLPSRIRGTTENRWSFTVPPRVPLPQNGAKQPAFRDFTIDPSQDLLVCTDVLTPNEVNVSLLTLSSGEPHPLAARHVLWSPLEFDTPELEAQSQEDADGSDLILVCGDHVALLTDSSLKVWNWKTGHLEKKLQDATLLESFCFLDPHHLLLLMYPNPEQVHLEVHVLGGLNQHASSVVSFHLPAIDPDSGYIIAGGSLHTDLQPSWTSLPQPSVPFNRDLVQDRLLMIAINMLHEETTDNGDATFFTPASTFLDMLATVPESSSTHTIPWESWGPQRTHATLFADIDEVWVCRLSGSRVILVPFDFDLKTDYCILDFSPTFLRSHAVTSDMWTTHTQNAFEWIPDDAELDTQGPFGGPFTTYLPYAELKVQGQHPVPTDARVPKWRWMMFEDGIVKIPWLDPDEDGDKAVELEFMSL